MCASIRVGGKGAEIDNYHAGGVGYPIDIASGIVFKPGVDIMGNRCLFHPSTQAKVVGFQIPRWKELKQFVAEAAMVYPQVSQVAWDIAVTDNGFELIEANLQGNSGFMQAPSEEGKLRIIERYRE